MTKETFQISIENSVIGFLRCCNGVFVRESTLYKMNAIEWWFMYLTKTEKLEKFEYGKANRKRHIDRVVSRDKSFIV